MICRAALALALMAQPPAKPPAAARARDAWFGADKLKHFFVAAFTQSVAYSALQAAGVRHDRALAGAWAATAAASVAKELYDKRSQGLFSVRDLVWDAAGAGAASVLLARVQRRESESRRAPAEATARVSVRVVDGVGPPRVIR